MKRWVLLSSFILFIALCGSVAFWSMQLFKPVNRQVAAPAQAPTAAVNIDAAASLFGGRPASVAVASNYQLKGVVVSGNAIESVAILSADGKPAQAIRVNREVSPGVTVREVHAQYILLNEGGVTKRVELPEGVKPQMGRTDGGGPPGLPPIVPPQTAPLVQPTVVNPQPQIVMPPQQVPPPPGMPPPPGQPPMQSSMQQAPMQPGQGDMPPPSAVGQPNIGGAPVIQQQQQPQQQQ